MSHSAKRRQQQQQALTTKQEEDSAMPPVHITGPPRRPQRDEKDAEQRQQRPPASMRTAATATSNRASDATLNHVGGDCAGRDMLLVGSQSSARSFSHSLCLLELTQSRGHRDAAAETRLPGAEVRESVSRTTCTASVQVLTCSLLIHLPVIIIVATGCMAHVRPNA